MKKYLVLIGVILLAAGIAYGSGINGGGGSGGGTPDDDSVTSAKIVDATIVAGDIADNTIGAEKLKAASGTPSDTTFFRGDNTWQTPPGTGDVVGPASATDGYFALWDNTTGKLLKDGFSSVNPAFSTINVTGANALNVGTAGSIDGSIRWKGAASADNYFPVIGANFTDNVGWILPTAAPGGANYLLNVDADGTMGYTDPATFLTPSGSAASLTNFPTLNQNTTGTAAALTANGANCNAGSAPLGVDASGAVESCFAVQASDADLTTLAAPTAWRVFYSNGSSVVTELTLGADGTYLKSNGATSAPTFATPAGTGDVVGPASATDNAVVLYDGTTGKLVKNSPCTLGTDNSLSCTGGFGSGQDAAQAGYVRLYELSGGGTNYVAWQAPDAITDTLTLKFPNANPSAQVLQFAAPSGGVSTGTWVTPVVEATGFATAASPDAGDGATLGTAALEWSDLYLADGAVIYGQNDQSATLTSSASTWTANNFAATTSLALPNGANPTTDAAGEIAVDTSATVGAGLRVYAHATYGAVTIPLVQTECNTIDNAIASNYMIGSKPFARTIREARYTQRAGTNWVGQIQNCDANGASCTDMAAADSTVTSSTASVTSFTDAAVAANEIMAIETTSVSGENTDVMVCVTWTVDAVN